MSWEAEWANAEAREKTPAHQGPQLQEVRAGRTWWSPASLEAGAESAPYRRQRGPVFETFDSPLDLDESHEWRNRNERPNRAVEAFFGMVKPLARISAGGLFASIEDQEGADKLWRHIARRAQIGTQAGDIFCEALSPAARHGRTGCVHPRLMSCQGGHGRGIGGFEVDEDFQRILSPASWLVLCDDCLGEALANDGYKAKLYYWSLPAGIKPWSVPCKYRTRTGWAQLLGDGRALGVGQTGRPA